MFPREVQQAPLWEGRKKPHSLIGADGPRTASLLHGPGGLRAVKNHAEADAVRGSTAASGAHSSQLLGPAHTLPYQEPALLSVGHEQAKRPRRTCHCRGSCSSRRPVRESSHCFVSVTASQSWTRSGTASHSGLAGAGLGSPPRPPRSWLGARRLGGRLQPDRGHSHLQLGLLARAVGAGWHLCRAGDTRALQLGRRRHDLLLHELLLHHLSGRRHCRDHLDLLAGRCRLREGHSLWRRLGRNRKRTSREKFPVPGAEECGLRNLTNTNAFVNGDHHLAYQEKISGSF